MHVKSWLRGGGGDLSLHLKYLPVIVCYDACKKLFAIFNMGVCLTTKFKQHLGNTRFKINYLLNPKFYKVS